MKVEVLVFLPFSMEPEMPPQEGKTHFRENSQRCPIRIQFLGVSWSTEGLLNERSIQGDEDNTSRGDEGKHHYIRI